MWKTRLSSQGIDNSIFEEQGPRDIYLMIPPLCTSGALNTINSITIEIEAVMSSTMLSDTDTTTPVWNKQEYRDPFKNFDGPPYSIGCCESLPPSYWRTSQ